MGTGFHVDPDQLRSHAATVAQVGTSITDAGSAAATEGFGGMVYGVLFDASIVPALAAWAQRLHSLIGGHADAAQAISKALKSNADTYDGIEHTTTQTVTRSGQPS